MTDATSPSQLSIPTAQNVDLADTVKPRRMPPPIAHQEKHYLKIPAPQTLATDDVPPVTRHGNYFLDVGDITFKVCNHGTHARVSLSPI